MRTPPKDRRSEQAQREGYRSRAAYKLLELDRENRILKRGRRVVDLGCWPGGWMQVAAKSVGPKGRVVGVDVTAMDSDLGIENVFAIQGDFSEPTVLQELLDTLGAPAQILLSDAAPNLTGVRAADRAKEEALLEAVEAAIPKLLAPGGTLLVKLLECPEAEDFVRRIRPRFEATKPVKTSATRKGSTERYLLAKGYKGVGG